MYVDLFRLMRTANSFFADREGLLAHPKYYNKQTLVIDLMDSLITQIKLRSMEELVQIKSGPDFKTDYISISSNQRENCCD